MTERAGSPVEESVVAHWLRAVGRPLLIGPVVAITLLFGGPSFAASPPRVWSSPIRISTSVSRNSHVDYSVACPTSTFCAAVNTAGDAVFWRHGKWSAPRELRAGGSLTSISCTSTLFCMAVSYSGESIRYNGRAWLSAGSLGPTAAYKISCSSSSFCVAVGANGLPGKPSTEAVYTGTRWLSHQTSTTGATDDRLLGVSCASSTFCAAVNFNGQVIAFNGRQWSVSDAGGPKGLTSVSCSSPTFCLAITDTGRSVAFNGTSWSSSRPIPHFGDAFAYSVSCASTSQCVVLGLNGSAARRIDTHWSLPTTVFSGGLTAGVDVACTASDSCMAVDARGYSAVS